MKELKNAILRSFILFFLGLSATVSLIDELITGFLVYLAPVEYRILVSISGGALQILTLIYFSFLFYRSLDQKITKKSQELARQQSRLFANIAHDLKTPLTSITGFSKALNEEVADPEETKEVAAIIYQKSLAANELLDLMFQYTKLHSADFELKKQDADIGYLLRETIADYYDLLEKQAIDLHIELPEEPVVCSVDKVEMKRVFANLVVNSCQHNPPQTRLLVAMETDAQNTKIIFADNGTPIPTAKREQLFEPFVSENEAERQFNGSGLGLAITKSIVEKHGFQIELLDGEGEYVKEFVIILKAE